MVSFLPLVTSCVLGCLAFCAFVATKPHLHSHTHTHTERERERERENLDFVERKQDQTLSEQLHPFEGRFLILLHLLECHWVLPLLLNGKNKQKIIRTVNKRK